MRRAPELERDQAPEEVCGLHDVVEKLPGAPRMTSKALAHSPAELADLADPSLERPVVRYAEQLTVGGEVDDTLHEARTAHLPPRQLIELALTVAAANFANRVNAALTLDLETPQP